MKSSKLLAAAAFTGVMLSALSFSSHAMDKYIENALIDVCKSTLTDNVSRFKKTVKSYNLRDKTIAMKVMCNGDDIIAFAQKHGANKTAARLENSINSRVNIIDVAAVEKIKLNF
jgi:hypothetical protein